MKVCLVAPTCADSSVPFGGGERYVEELAKALAAHVETKLVSFAPVGRRSRPKPGLERVVLRSWTRDPMTPFSPRLGSELRGCDVVHCFQYFTLSTFFAAWRGKRQGSRVFVTDLGGGGWTPAYQIDQSRWIDAHLPLSAYASRSLPGRPLPVHVLLGGVDTSTYRMRARPDHDGSVVFLGRVLPHKGVHVLLEAMPPERPLRIVGPTPDSNYLDRLRVLAKGKQVEFLRGLSDEKVASLLQAAMVLVHATPVDEQGSAGANELLGLALLEAMACGCPVIASDVASLPEIVVSGVTGWTVRPGDPSRIRLAIEELARDRPQWQRFSAAARARVESEFLWSETERRCRLAYENDLPERVPETPGRRKGEGRAGE